MMFAMQRKRRIATTAAALAVGVTLLVTGCSGSTGGTDGGDRGGGDDANLSITMLPKNLGNPYFDTSTGGAEEATEEFGGTFEEVGPSEASPPRRSSTSRPPRSRVPAGSSSRRTILRRSATPSTRRARRA